MRYFSFTISSSDGHSQLRLFAAYEACGIDDRLDALLSFKSLELFLASTLSRQSGTLSGQVSTLPRPGLRRCKCLAEAQPGLVAEFELCGMHLLVVVMVVMVHDTPSNAPKRTNKRGGIGHATALAVARRARLAEHTLRRNRAGLPPQGDLLHPYTALVAV